MQPTKDVESAFFAVSDSLKQSKKLAFHPRKYTPSLPSATSKACHSGSGTQIFTSVCTQQYKHIHKSLRTRDEERKEGRKLSNTKSERGQPREKKEERQKEERIIKLH